jgi:hypothetical protein
MTEIMAPDKTAKQKLVHLTDKTNDLKAELEKVSNNIAAALEEVLPNNLIAKRIAQIASAEPESVKARDVIDALKLAMQAKGLMDKSSKPSHFFQMIINMPADQLREKVRSIIDEAKVIDIDARDIDPEVEVDE